MGPTGTGCGCFPLELAIAAQKINRDLKDVRRFVTLDFWTSESAYDSFRAEHQIEYKMLDAKFEALTESEVEIGRFVRMR